MPGLFAGTSLERPVTCAVCEKPLSECRCPRDASGAVLLSHEQTAIIAVEKRKKGKTVTTINGLDSAANDLPAILKSLKSNCGAGGTIDDSVIEVQGDHRDTIAAELRRLGYQVKSR